MPALRSLKIDSAQGCIDTSPGFRSLAKSRRYFGFGFQMPDKSGFPSASLGAGAVKFGLPSAVRGTPGVVSFSHWAATGQAANNMTMAAIRKTFMFSPRQV